MKKMFTLFSGLLLAVAVMAADRRPVVTVNSMKNYKIVIDGKAYFSGNSSIHIANLRNGYHFIQVFEMRRGYFERRERLVASTSFSLRRNDVRILIDYFGNIRIKERKGYGRFERDDRDWNDRDMDRDRDNDRDQDRNRDRDRRDDDNRRF